MRVWLLSVVIATVAFAVPSCGGSVGGEGEACLLHGDPIPPDYGGGVRFSGNGYSCNPGLVCNAGHYPPFCQVPHTFGVDAHCSQDANCMANLYCDGVCQNLRTVGQDCYAITARCRPGLYCVPKPMGWGASCATSADAGPMVDDAGGGD
jgi:hypothetical protein